MPTNSTTSFDFAKYATKIVDEAKNASLTLRVMGATAFRIHCPNNLRVHDALARTLSDLDFVSYSNNVERIERLFTGPLEYQPVRAALTPGLFAGRLIFVDKSGVRPHVDVFLDRLEMNHTIDFKGRLETDYPTIPLAELLLEKVQIVKINEKDIKDLIVLLLEHDVGQGDKETINMQRIVKIMAGDWPFYYTTTTNLNKVKGLLPKYDVLTDEQRGHIASRIDKLLQAIENEPKSFKWKTRAMIGPSKKWYTEVEEVERAEHLGSAQT
ncbi:MAG: hypothetical protein ABSG74_03095 [Candidatus Bathyarchaeia archaeon]